VAVEHGFDCISIMKSCVVYKAIGPPGADAIKKFTPSLGIPYLGI